MDFILNGQASGSVAQTLIDNDFDTGALRPYKVKPRGQTYVTQNRYNAETGEVEPVAIPVHNANATLLDREWKQIDTVVVRAALPRLRIVADLRGRGLEYTIPGGMSKTVLQSQSQSDISPATISMDGLADSPGDRPIYDLRLLPLPIIHKDFSFSAREIAVSRNGNMPLDTSTAELAARRVAEGAEQLAIGTGPNYAYGGGNIYGFTNFPGRITKTLTNPTTGGWVPRTILLEVLSMKLLSQQALHFGPWVLYVSLAWDAYLDDDLSVNKGDLTVRDRLRRIEQIEDVVTVDFLLGYDMVLVQQSPDVVREVIGMDLTTVQWEEHGGMKLNFKVMCIMVPQVRGDFNGNTGIVHGSVSGVTTAPANTQTMYSFNP